MSIPALLERLRTRGIHLWVEADRLRFRAPPGAVDDTVRGEIQDRRDDLVRFLNKVKLIQAGVPEPPRPVDHGPHPPLSPAQSALWFHDQLVPGQAIYNIPTAVRMEGRLAVTVLEKAFTDLCRRQRVLRTVYPDHAGEPYQQLLDNQAVDMDVTDLSGLDESRRQTEVRVQFDRESRRPFNLRTGPIYRLALFKLSDELYVLNLTIHHIAADGWSMGVLLDNLSHDYGFRLRSGFPTISRPRLQYLDVARWQQSWMDSAAALQQLEFWQNYLADLPDLKLPLDGPRGDGQTFRGQTLAWVFPDHLAADLRTLAKAEGVSLFVLSTTLFTAVLHVWTGQTDVPIGTDLANRTQSEFQDLVGFFVNQVVLRIDLDHDPDLRDLWRQVREHMMRIQTNGQLPFDKVVKTLLKDRDLAHTPLFQVKVVHQPSFRDLTLPGLSLVPMAVDHGTAKFDLLLNLSDTAGALTWTLEYNADLFQAATIEDLAGRLKQAVRLVVDDPAMDLATFRQQLQDKAREERLDRGQQRRARRSGLLDKVRAQVESQTVAGGGS